MTTWNPHANELFLKALELASASERQQYLDGACGADADLRAEVEALLQASAQAGNFLQGPAHALSATVDAPITERPGTVIGPYKLLEQIGEGGFGVVFMAEQTQPVRRKVALKVLKPGMDTRQVVARFEAERQALALMDHPNIAKVLDGGQTASGRPYFVMDLVKGLPITSYCDQAQLTLRESLELFVQVCQAVQHAHQKGVIHRDLKPSNVLVMMQDAKPVVKVIDFGVAKALGQELTDKTLFTGFAQMIGTPLYMSPEQAGQSGVDIDTRSDIYSLGVLLYELLTGTTPFDKERLRQVGYDEMRRIIREEEPPKPSTRISTLGQAATTASTQRKSNPRQLSRLLRGELDWIVMKALEKDRNRRYETASAFAADVQRYLHDEPVQACPPSAWYRFGKFVRRNKRALAAAALVAVMVLGAGGAWLWAEQDRVDRAAAAARREAEIERDRADRAAAAARREAEIERDATLALQEGAHLQEQGKYMEALPALRKTEGLLAGGGSAELRERVVDMRENLAMLARVEEIRLRQAELRADSIYDYRRVVPLFAQAFRDYGIDVMELEPAEAAERIRRRTIRAALVTALYEWSAMVPNKAERERVLAVAKAADTEGVFRAWIEALAAKDGAAVKQLAASVKTESLAPPTLRVMGNVLFARGYEVEALELLRRARRQYPGDFWLNHDLAFALWQLTGGNRIRVGLPASATIEHGGVTVVVPDKTAVPTGSPSTANDPRLEEAVYYLAAADALRPHNPVVQMNLGVVFFLQGKWEEAARAFREAIKVRQDLALAHAELGQTLHMQQKYDQALEEINEAIHLQPDMALAHNALGRVLAAKGQRDAAIAAYQKAIQHQPSWGAPYWNLGNMYLAKGLQEEAAVEFEKAIQRIQKEAVHYRNLGYLYLKMGLPEKAVAVFEKATQFLPNEPEGYFHLAVALAKLRREGQVPAGERAIKALRKAVELKADEYYWHYFLGLMLSLDNRYEEAAEAFIKAVHHKPDFAEGHYSLGGTYRELKKFKEAAAEFREAVRHQPDLFKAHYELGVVCTQLGDFDAAAAAFKGAIRYGPEIAETHFKLGGILYRQGKFAEAAAALRQAIALKPDYAAARRNLGLTLAQLGKFDESAAAYRAYLEYRPKQGDGYLGVGLSLVNQGKYADALAALEAGSKVISRDDPYRSQIEESIRNCMRLVELDRKLPGVLKREIEPAGAEEQIELAKICTTKKLFGAAAHLSQEAFTAQPGLAADLNRGYRYAAAGVAALAAAGRGKDQPPLDDRARAHLRQQAVAWLRADLAAWTKRLENGTPADRATVRQLMEHWQKNTDLAGIREQVAVANLPQAESEACRQLWADVAELLSKVKPAVKEMQQEADFAGLRGDALARLPEAEHKPWQQLWADVEQTLSKAICESAEESNKKPSN
jgi:serine/threonine protein kinase/Tfp pilus assembly protein PilF